MTPWSAPYRKGPSPTLSHTPKDVLGLFASVIQRLGRQLVCSGALSWAHETLIWTVSVFLTPLSPLHPWTSQNKHLFFFFSLKETLYPSYFWSKTLQKYRSRYEVFFFFYHHRYKMFAHLISCLSSFFIRPWDSHQPLFLASYANRISILLHWGSHVQTAWLSSISGPMTKANSSKETTTRLNSRRKTGLHGTLWVVMYDTVEGKFDHLTV